ncbi:hypothetical protein LTS18_010756 [Coniosporium uncinatum]|uniref:Uncharacterized protein n=1 Tax=Coniosporium uncinatum TaxID=93489 RepID=A0ACC3DKN9_9PEZI|nr:hypothetical protein LTS18_010756 [Coniosporium uncinatum]
MTRARSSTADRLSTVQHQQIQAGVSRTPKSDMEDRVPTPRADIDPNILQSSEAKRKKHPNAAATLTFHSLRGGQWAYFHLWMYSSPPSPAASTFDAITARTHLTSALRQFLGLHGQAIPVDIIKMEGQDVWIRVPMEDASAVQAAVSGWTGGDTNAEGGRTLGWRVKERDEWVGRLGCGDGQDLFGC